MPRSIAKNVTTSTTTTPVQIDEDAVMSLLMDLLPIPGLSGKEGAIIDFVTGKLRKAGVPARQIQTDDVYTRSPLGGEVGNLVCHFPGTIPGERRLLMAHLDTVPLCAGTVPVRDGDFIRSGNPLTGLGGDNRSGVCAILNAALTIMTKKIPHPPLTFFFPVQEEVGLFGARFADRELLLNPALCFNWDGGLPNRLTIGATGAYRIHINVTGLASHAGVHPEEGVSALAIAGIAIADLCANGWHGLIDKKAGKGTSNIGLINGGSATNVVADACSIKAEARSHNAKFRNKIKNAFESAFLNAAKKVKNHEKRQGKISFKADLHYESFCLPSNSPSVIEAQRAVQALGLKPELIVSNGGLDANWMTVHGFPTVSLGAGQKDVHTLAEKLHIPSFLNGCRMALALATTCVS